MCEEKCQMDGRSDSYNSEFKFSKLKFRAKKSLYQVLYFVPTTVDFDILHEPIKICTLDRVRVHCSRKKYSLTAASHF